MQSSHLALGCIRGRNSAWEAGVVDDALAIAVQVQNVVFWWGSSSPAPKEDTVGEPFVGSRGPARQSF